MIYRVEWAIDIDAESPEDAARKAWEIMRKPDSTANVFDVLDGTENHRVDFQVIKENY